MRLNLLKRLIGLICFFFFYGGSGLHFLISDFNFGLNAFFKAELASFIIEQTRQGPDENIPVLFEAAAKLGIEATDIGSVFEILPDNLVTHFVIREATQVIFSSAFLLIGILLFRSSYKAKSEKSEAKDQ